MIDEWSISSGRRKRLPLEPLTAGKKKERGRTANLPQPVQGGKRGKKRGAQAISQKPQTHCPSREKDEVNEPDRGKKRATLRREKGRSAGETKGSPRASGVARTSLPKDGEKRTNTIPALVKEGKGGVSACASLLVAEKGKKNFIVFFLYRAQPLFL